MLVRGYLILWMIGQKILNNFSERRVKLVSKRKLNDFSTKILSTSYVY